MAKKRFDLDPIPQPSAPARDQALTASPDGSQPLIRARLVPLARLVADPEQPRTNIDPSDPALQDLAASLQAQGMRQPITAYYDDSREQFVVISGERRMRAAAIARLAEVPVLVEHRPASDADRLVLQLAENLVREDLTAPDAARALARLRDLRPTDWLEVAARHGFGRRRSYQYLELLDDPQILRDAVATRAISEGHAAELRRAPAGRQDFLLREVVSHGLSVSDTRQLIKRDQQRTHPTRNPAEEIGRATPVVVANPSLDDVPVAPAPRTTYAETPARSMAVESAQPGLTVGQVAEIIAETTVVPDEPATAPSPSLGAALLEEKQRRVRSRQLRQRLDRIASELRNMHVDEVAAELTNLPEILVQARHARESLDAFIALLERVQLDRAGTMEPPPA